MIPKIIFQTSLIKPPNYVVDLIRSKSVGWEYNHFTDEEIIQFIEMNPINEFVNSINVFKSIQIAEHRADFFRYYFIYIKGGVFIDSDAMIEQDIDTIIKQYSFFTVHSGLQKNSMFNGFIGAEPRNDIIYLALKHIYFVDKNVLSSDSFLVCKELKHIIDSTRLTNYKLFQEFKGSELAIIMDEKTIVLNHFYKTKLIISNLPFEPKQVKLPKNTKIGITFDIPLTLGELFSNGIRQNILYFNELLLNIGYDSYFIVNNLNKVNQTDLKKMMYDTRFRLVDHTDIVSFEFDVVIVMGYFLESFILNKLRYMKVKTIGHFCGNSYIINSEKILYNIHPPSIESTYDITNDFIHFDQIWTLPHMIKTNKNYWEILYRCDCVEVPLVWSNKCIHLLDYEQLMFKTRGESKRIAIFEPNISIMKSCLPPLLIVENSYRKNKHLIDRVFVTNIINPDGNIKSNININSLERFLDPLDLNKDKKVSIEGRIPSLIFMSNFADIIVSHQWENNLNYLYLDMAWMGWPIVHNGSLCSDIGYYYEGFNYKEGSEILNRVLLEHDKNAKQYLENNRKIIDRYFPSNKALQNDYQRLIESLFTAET